MKNMQSNKWLHSVLLCIFFFGFAFLPSCKDQSVERVENDSFVMELVDMYSDTHLSISTFRITGKEIEFSDTTALNFIDSELLEPDYHSFAQTAFCCQDAWLDNGSVIISYRMYTVPTHDDIVIHLKKIGRTGIDLTFPVPVKKAVCKTGKLKESEGSENKIYDIEVMVSEKSWLILYEQPDKKSIGVRETVPVTLAGEDGTVYHSVECTVYAVGSRTEPKKVRFALHSFSFDEDLPLSDITQVIIDGEVIAVK